MKPPDLSDLAAAGEPPPTWEDGGVMGATRGRSGPLAIGVADFFATCDPAIEWLVEPFIFRRGFSLVVGAPKSGKTWFVAWLSATAAAAGKRVVFVEEEGAAEVLRDRLSPFVQPDPKAFNDNLRVAFRKGVRLDDPAVVEALIAECKDVDVLVLDPFVSLHGKDENEQSEIGPVLRAIQQIISATGCAVVLVHHTRKTDWDKGKKHGASSAEARGSGALVGSVDVVISLRSVPAKLRRPGEVRFFVENPDTRVGAPFGKRLAVLKLGVGVGTLEWEDIDEGEQENADGILRRALPSVSREPACISQEALRDAVGVGKHRLAEAVALGIARGDLKKLPKGLCRPAADPDPDCDSDLSVRVHGHGNGGRTGLPKESVSPPVRPPIQHGFVLLAGEEK